eukprot:2717541-Prymnesium_polylepis.2
MPHGTCHIQLLKDNTCHMSRVAVDERDHCRARGGARHGRAAAAASVAARAGGLHHRRGRLLTAARDAHHPVSYTHLRAHETLMNL